MQDEFLNQYKSLPIEEGKAYIRKTYEHISLQRDEETDQTIQKAYQVLLDMLAEEYKGAFHEEI